MSFSVPGTIEHFSHTKFLPNLRDAIGCVEPGCNLLLEVTAGAYDDVHVQANVTVDPLWTNPAAVVKDCRIFSAMSAAEQSSLLSVTLEQPATIVMSLEEPATMGARRLQAAGLTPLSPPPPPPLPVDECGRVLYMLNRPDVGLSAMVVADLSAMSRELCVEVEPCEASSALGQQTGAAHKSVQQAQGAAALNLLAGMPSQGGRYAAAADAALQRWTSVLRQQLAARPCDPALRSSAKSLLSKLLSRGEVQQSSLRARMSPPEVAAASRLRGGHEWSILRPD